MNADKFCKNIRLKNPQVPSTPPDLTNIMYIAMINEPMNIAPKNLVMMAPESCIAYWSKKDLVPNTHLNPYTAYPMKCKIKTTKRIIPLNFSIIIDSYHNSFKYSFIILSQ